MATYTITMYERNITMVATSEDSFSGAKTNYDIPYGQTDIPSDNYDFLVTAKTGYTILSCNIKINTVDNYFTISADEKSGTVNVDITSNSDIVIQTEEELPLVTMNNDSVTITAMRVDAFTGDTITYNIDYGVENQIPVSNYDFTATVPTGTRITSCYITIDGIDTQFTIATNEESGTLNIDITSNADIFIDIIVDTPPQVVNTGFNNLYLVDTETLISLTTERFQRVFSDSSISVIDIGDFFIEVLELPFPINEQIKGVIKPIKTGEYQLETQAVQLISDTINVNLGSIDIPSKYNNTYDYINTNVNLHLPFSHTVEININYAISQTLNITYMVDLYSGETTVNITSTKLNDELIFNDSIKIGRSIPFLKSNGEKYPVINGINNNLYTAFIEVIRNKPYEINGVFNTDMLRQTTLINETGFMRVNNVILNTEASLQEKNNIVSLLKSGVFIK